ncbi:O-antigen ligase family protein [Spirosoma radiotolerans]|nr:O-antigen ligase family protein [Spirosoma radiotolerans]
MPILFIALGFALSTKISSMHFLKIIVLVGFFTSVMSVLISISKVGFGALLDPYSARIIGRAEGSPAPILGSLILLYCNSGPAKVFKRSYALFFLLFNLLGIYMAASRTYWIFLFCVLLVLYIRKLNAMRGSALFAILFCMLVSVASIQTGDFLAKSDNSFVNKFMHSFREIDIKDYKSDEDVNMSYRGFESYKGMATYYNGQFHNLLIGRGLGQTIDLGLFIDLGGSDFKKIPILHNGYVYTLVKMGAFGLLMTLFFYLSLFRDSWRFSSITNQFAKNIFLIVAGSVFGLLVTNYSIASFYNVNMVIFSIFIGYYISFGQTAERRLLVKRKCNTSIDTRQLAIVKE